MLCGSTWHTCVYARYFPDIYTFQIFIYILFFWPDTPTLRTLLPAHISQLFFGQSHVLVRGRMWNFIIPARMRARDAQLWCHRILFISIYVCSPQRKEINKTKWGHNTFGFSIFWRFRSLFFLFVLLFLSFSCASLWILMSVRHLLLLSPFAIFCLVCYAKCILQQTSRKSTPSLFSTLSLSLVYLPPQLGIF